MKLYASIDFFDEMCFAVWTPEMLDEYFCNMKSKGISRIYWIDQKEIMMRSGRKELSERMRLTWENFNNDLTRAAVRLARKNGLEIFAIIKPYDLGIRESSVSDGGENLPGIDVVGGRALLCTDFAIRHPEVMLKRQVFPAPGRKAVKYRLSFAEPLKEEGSFKVYGSNDNRNYELVSERKVPCGSSFIDEPVSKWTYMVFTLENVEAVNTIGKIVSALDSEGNEVPFSLALVPAKRYADTSYHLDFSRIQSDDGGFRKRGMLFDYLPGVPSSIYSPDTVENKRLFDFAEAQEHAVGVTLELNSHVPGCPDPEHPVFRQFIRDWTAQELERGFDGIEIRISNHNSPMFWREYGTGREVRLARGNAHLSLLRELSASVRSKGKKFGLHVANLMFGSTPDQSSPMEFFWDYRTWIHEKLCDEVTAKLIGADGFSPESMELLELCRAQQIPVNYCRFLQALPDPLDYAGRTAAVGVDAFNIYEAATVWKGYEKGVFLEKSPEQAALLWQIPEI